MNSVPEPGSIAFYPFTQGAVLHKNGAHKLLVLNAPAATLWCLLDQTDDMQQLAGAYARRFNLNPEKAQNEVEALLETFSQWRRRQAPPAPDPATAPSTSPSPGPQHAAPEPIHSTSFTVAGQNFTLRCTQEQTAAQWLALTEPLAGQKPSTQAAVELLITPDPADPERCLCCSNGRRLTTGLLPENAVPYLVFEFFDHTSAALNDRLLLHAAVLAHKGKTFVFAAQAGAGKSTLAAALSRAGWTYLSDELAIIDPHTAQVEPYPIPICLKVDESTPSPLQDIIPGLHHLPVHTRADGRKTRYLMPARVRKDGSFAVAALIFPQYSKGQTTRVKPVEPLEALARLSSTGSSNRALTEADIKALLKLAQGPAFELIFDDLKATTETLKQYTDRSRSIQ